MSKQKPKAKHKWMPDFDMTSIPDKVFRSEWSRRASAKRETFGGGRPKKLEACPGCGDVFSVGDMRKHKPQCPGKQRSKNPLSGSKKDRSKQTT